MKTVNVSKKRPMKSKYWGFHPVCAKPNFIFLLPIILLAAEHDYIPKKNEEFDDWQENFMTEATANLALIGVLVTDADWVALLALQTSWVADWAAGKPAAAGRTKGKVQAMQDTRKAYEKALRNFYKKHIAFNDAVDNSLRTDMGVTVYDETKTAIALPAHPPIGVIAEIGHLYHKLEIKNVDTPDSKKIPNGIEVQVFRFITDDPTPAPDATFQMVDEISVHQFQSDFPPTQEKKKAFYYLKWTNPKGEVSPPSEIFSATIA